MSSAVRQSLVLYSVRRFRGETAVNHRRSRCDSFLLRQIDKVGGQAIDLHSLHGTADE